MADRKKERETERIDAYKEGLIERRSTLHGIGKMTDR